MIKRGQLIPLFLALALGAMGLWAMGLQAQQAQEKTVEVPAAATQPTEKPGGAQQAPPAPSTAPNTTGEDSPFEYRSSEQISEDVPVSFPVDI